MKPDWFDAGWPHIWLPYAQMKTVQPPLPVRETRGCKVILEDGRELVDGIASWWSACHGHRHPHMVEAIQKQAETLPHVMFGGLAHGQAYRLAARLCKIAPEGISRVFYADSGSVAVEVALKMAMQYWRNAGQPNKERFLCFRHGYHGDTSGAMAVSDPEQNMHKAFRHLMNRAYVVDIPNDEYSLQEFASLLADESRHIAACIIEPLVQGAGGMKFHSADILAEMHRLCRENDVLFIADEIATGFGRTGSMFACQEAGITPDIMTIGKALTGGMLTLAATMTTDAVFQAFYSEDPEAALMHGPTYMGNALACAAANASLDLFEREPRLQQVAGIEAALQAALAPLESLPSVADMRVKGAIGVVQLHPEHVDIPALRAAFVAENVWVRPIEDVIYLTPPFTIDEAELKQLTDAVAKVVAALPERPGA